MGKLNAVKMFTFEDKDYLKDDGTPCRRVSYDYCVAGYMGSSFCEGGDSGAFMMDEDGKFIGLLFGGDLKSALTRVLVAEDLFDDIKHVTGAKVVRLPVA